MRLSKGVFPTFPDFATKEIRQRRSWSSCRLCLLFYSFIRGLFFTGAFVFPIPKFRRCSFEIYRSYLYVCVFRFFIVIISFPFASRPLFRNENFHDKKRTSASSPDPQRVLFLKKNVGNFALIFFRFGKEKCFFTKSANRLCKCINFIV